MPINGLAMTFYLDKLYMARKAEMKENALLIYETNNYMKDSMTQRIALNRS